MSDWLCWGARISHASHLVVDFHSSLKHLFIHPSSRALHIQYLKSPDHQEFLVSLWYTQNINFFNIRSSRSSSIHHGWRCRIPHFLPRFCSRYGFCWKSQPDDGWCNDAFLYLPYTWTNKISRRKNAVMQSVTRLKMSVVSASRKSRRSLVFCMRIREFKGVSYSLPIHHLFKSLHGMWSPNHSCRTRALACTKNSYGLSLTTR